MAGSLAFYVDALHFSTLFTANAAHVKRVPPDGLYLLGLDPDGLLPGLPAGVRVLQPPVTQPSGMREAVIVDPVNGYVITVAKSMGPGGGGGVEMQRG
ncbi:hypothetical protein I4F81_004911 [Pyropia yezoensis]|uniref:Uncharacterized protein n=1 Tax=Pyropia yezoensis TaxID=2788 RepID=A0ACC3BWS0_PYRYE|nr:hypothetical protein I4F81_004911 [Neopyropia yezoensis]